MAFKRVLSVFLILLVLVSTLCAFKPAEAYFEARSAVTERNVNSFSITIDMGDIYSINTSANVYLNSGATRVLNFSNTSRSQTLIIDSNTRGLDVRFNERTGKYDAYFSLSMPWYQINISYTLGAYSYGWSDGEIAYLDEMNNGSTFSVTQYGLVVAGVQISKTIVVRDVQQYGYVITDEDLIYSQGYRDGYELGYNTGLSDNTAYQQGQADGVSRGLYGLFADPIGALLNFTIIPASSSFPAITLGGVLLTVIGISLVIVFLKYFAGG